MRTLSPLLGRLLALALLLGLLLAGHGLLVRPLLAEWQANEALIAQSRELLARYRQIAAARPLLERQLDQLEATDVAWVYLEGASDALAAAALQERVRALAAEAGGELRSTQILPASDDAGLRRIGLRIQLGLDAEALQSVLHELETGTPLVFVDNLVVRARQQARRRAMISEDDPTLEVALDLYGYLRPERP